MHLVIRKSLAATTRWFQWSNEGEPNCSGRRIRRCGMDGTSVIKLLEQLQREKLKQSKEVYLKTLLRMWERIDGILSSGSELILE